MCRQFVRLLEIAVIPSGECSVFVRLEDRVPFVSCSSEFLWNYSLELGNIKQEKKTQTNYN